MRWWLARRVDELLALLWPATCSACGVLADGGAFCGECALTLEPLQPACPRCAMPLAAPGARCGDCARRRPPFASAHSAYRYGAAMARAIVEMKHGRRRDIARSLAPLLLPSLAAAAGEDAGALIAAPVPLHPSRLRQRGFNQALELLLGARACAERSAGWGRVLARRLTLDRELLVRVRDTPDLGHAGPAERARRVAGAFALRRRRRVTGSVVLLVDDVLTTGATAGECARILLAEGAAEVRVVTLARAG